MSGVEQQQVRRDRKHTFDCSNSGSAARLEVGKRGEGKGKAAVRKRGELKGKGKGRGRPRCRFNTRC